MKHRDDARTSSATPSSSDKAINKLSSTSSSSPILIATPSSVQSMPDAISLEGANMESSQDNAGAATRIQPSQQDADQKDAMEAQPSPPDAVNQATKAPTKDKSEKPKSQRATKASSRKADVSSASDASDSDSESSSEDDKAKQKAKRKLAAKRVATKKKRQKAKAKSNKSKKHDKESEEGTSASSSDTDSESEVQDKKSRRKALRAKAKKMKSKKAESSTDDSESTSSSSSSSSDSDSDSEDEKAARRRAKAKRKAKMKKAASTASSTDSSSSDEETAASPSDAPVLPSAAAEAAIDEAIKKYGAILNSLSLQKAAAAAAAAVGAVKEEKPAKKKKLEFKRVDQVYDMSIHDWTLVESNKEQKDEFDCVFTVRRRLDWDGKYKETQIDLKSKVLRNALQEVFKECKSISLVEDKPQIDPHTLFHYYDELSKFVKKTLKARLKKAKKSKVKKQLKQQIAQCKLLLGYIDEDYEATRKALKPMIKAGTITFDLVWALFKPNTIAYTPTYTNKDDPRCFKVDSTFEEESWMSGQKSWVVDGRYLEYDGKVFGLGDYHVSIPAFKGHKKITSLATYPLQYHQDPEGIKQQLIARGKKFVALQGMNFRALKGIAYMKHKCTVIRFNINGRVMVDPAIFRRINPNYPVSYVKQDEFNDGQEQEQEGEGAEKEDADDGSCCSGEDTEKEEPDKLRRIMWKDKKGKRRPIYVFQSEIDEENGRYLQSELQDVKEGAESKQQIFTEEELLISSPVVLGFAFSEKLWLEFSLFGIEEIKWNSEAFSSLVLPARIKQNLKGLVSSHRFNAARTIDDVIKGKGKGLNVVLHGPPGVGKTLTGESIAEYLKCPLYAVSAGELGTNCRTLETDLNRIMDITHSWGAILLLDEADVFLEARQPHDIVRNSLVSVFLRLTEYYQGILFLTTNRVETFDEAFQSRIHMGIRYENLSVKARREIWKWHIGKAESMRDTEEKKEREKEKTEGAEEGISKSGELFKPFTEANFDELSKRVMNGRQIKNTVKTSQSIALSEKTPFGMEHVKRVLESVDAFEDDMRGGVGYRDAMRQYT